MCDDSPLLLLLVSCPRIQEDLEAAQPIGVSYIKEFSS
jgi:hypothetical protein